MRIEINHCKLHAPLFVGKMNMGEQFGKGQPKVPDKIEYDTELECLIVYFKNDTALVPAASVAFMNVSSLEQQLKPAPAEVQLIPVADDAKPKTTKVRLSA